MDSNPFNIQHLIGRNDDDVKDADESARLNQPGGFSEDVFRLWEFSSFPIPHEEVGIRWVGENMLE
ncbi:MAG: hypothetical protein CL581_14150 [Alteromonadaceae bacterium]|nr:hypothetical protein [Alteromonadaceae bacterium]